MKTELTNGTLVDLLVVVQALPQEEIDQINAFSENEFDYESFVGQLFGAPGPKYTIRVKETGEPLAVSGLVQVGVRTWRTWFLANQRAWDEFGKEVTVHTNYAREQLLEPNENMRIETVCLATRKKAQRWYEAVGMKYESTMHGYGKNGESAVMYVSTKGARNY